MDFGSVQSVIITLEGSLSAVSKPIFATIIVVHSSTYSYIVLYSKIYTSVAASFEIYKIDILWHRSELKKVQLNVVTFFATIEVDSPGPLADYWVQIPACHVKASKTCSGFCAGSPISNLQWNLPSVQIFKLSNFRVFELSRFQMLKLSKFQGFELHLFEFYLVSS